MQQELKRKESPQNEPQQLKRLLKDSKPSLIKDVRRRRVQLLSVRLRTGLWQSRQRLKPQ
jgi:hypothetical protein